MKKIFLISGYARHGKDSTARIMSDLIGGRNLILHNADYLKYICKEYCEWDGKKDDTGRNLLQYLGTDRVRVELNKPLFWVEKTCDTIEILYNKFDHFFVPDCRFVNELYYPEARFPNETFSIRVIRNNFDNGLTKEQKNHLSETSLDNVGHNFYLRSESGLDNLEKNIVEMLKKL